MSQLNLEDHIRSLIAENEIEEAIEQMSKEGYEVTLLRQRWAGLKDQMIFKTKSEESLDRKEAQIVMDIMKMLDGKHPNDAMKAKTETENVAEAQTPESSEAKGEATLYEKWLKSLKNNPIK